VKSKRSYRCAAKDLYFSTLFNTQREYASAISRRWFILSAKYGLLDPETEIEPYEKTLNGARIPEKRAWAEQVAKSLRPAISPSDLIIITAEKTTAAI
jgi:hypothetical protein